MRNWVEESRRVLASQSGGFCVIVDMRALNLLTPEVQQAMVEG